MSRSSSATAAAFSVHAPGHERLERRGLAPEDRAGIGLEPFQQLGVERQAVLRHLGEPGAVVAIGERREQLRRRRAPHAAGRTSRPGSCPRGGSPRSCRRSPSRPGPSASWAPARTAGPACRSRPRSPARSPVDPPPNATTTSSRCASWVASWCSSVPYTWSDFASSPEGTESSTGVEPGRLQAAREGPEPAVDDRAVGDDERARGLRELGQQRAGLRQHARAHHDVVGASRDRNGHADQRSSSTIASATSPGVPLPSTTCAANSR